MKEKTMSSILLWICLGVWVLGACSSSHSDTWRSEDLEYIPVRLADAGMILVNSEGKKITNGVHSVGLFREGLALMNDTAYCFIDKKGEIVGKTWQSATFFNGGVAWAVEAGSPLFIINKKGEKLAEVKSAEWAIAFNEGLAVFYDQSERAGVVDKKGKVVISPLWIQTAPYYVNGMLAVRDENGKWGMIDDKGKILINCQFDNIGGLGENDDFGDYIFMLGKKRLIVCKEKRWGVVDQNGNFLINPQFDALHPDGDLFLMKKGSLYGWCDKTGKYVINPQFKTARQFANTDLAPVESKDYQWGYINKKGEYAIQPQYKEARSFYEGVAVVKMGKEWGAIDEKGQYVINPQFVRMNDFWQGLSIVKDAGTRDYGLVDKSGKYVINPDYRAIGEDYALSYYYLGSSAVAQSLYVDFEPVVTEMMSIIKSVDVNQTAGELKSKYHLKESSFSKQGEVELFSKEVAYNTKLRLKADCYVWQRVSDGWFGYNYNFKSNARPDAYYLVVELQGKAAKHTDIFRKEFGKQWDITEASIGDKMVRLLAEDDEGQLIFGIDKISNEN